MEVHTDLSTFARPAGGTAVTIGAFDGLHLGHQAVLSRLRHLAAGVGAETAVVTFDRHPAAVVRPASAPMLLTDLDQKLEALLKTGDVDHVVVLHFDEQRAREEAEDFVHDVLEDGLGARVVVAGSDFHFGRGRRGNMGMLREMGSDGGFEVVALDLVGGEGGDLPAVSSTHIRALVARGDVDAAGRMLGRPYEVRGHVGSGDARGRELGFPTANVAVPPEMLLPGDGIYAGWYERRAGEPAAYPAAISIGRRPTFPGSADPRPVLEAYLLDFEGDLYGEQAAVRFTARLRDEERFETVDALVAQIEADVERTKAALGV